MAAPDFPHTLIEFERRFSTDQACDDFLAQCRWPNGFVCPKCGHSEAWVISTRHLRECKSCRHQVSTTAGTILHGTRTDLSLWFLAAFLMITDKRGLSALSLQRQIGVNRYETAWMMLHKLRRATVAANRTKLSGVVEVDEGWIGGEQNARLTAKGMPGGRSRAGRNAALAVFAVETANGVPKRIRIKIIPDNKASHARRVHQGSCRTGLDDHHRRLEVVCRVARGRLHAPAHRRGLRRGVCEPGASRAHRDRQSEGVADRHAQGVWPRHLGAYLDEFTFRYNRRHNLALAFRTLLGIGSSRGPTHYKTINGAQDMPKITYTPSNRVTGRGTGKPRGRPPKKTAAVATSS